MKQRTWKIGDLARATGLTVRSLRFYEQAGLLPKALRTEAGHRVYSENHVRRLHQIVTLKELGLPLDEMKRLLNKEKMSPIATIHMHKRSVMQERIKLQKLEQVLTNLEDAWKKKGTLSIEELLEVMEAMKMHEKYFTKEQLEQLAKRREVLGDEKMKEVEGSWPKLIEAVRAEMKAGTPPDHPRVQKLAKQWNANILAFTGGDKDLRMKLRDMYRNEPSVREKSGIDPEMNAYVGRMMSVYGDDS